MDSLRTWISKRVSWKHTNRASVNGEGFVSEEIAARLFAERQNLVRKLLKERTRRRAVEAAGRLAGAHAAAVQAPGYVTLADDGRTPILVSPATNAAPAAQPADSARLAALEAAVQQLCREFGAPQTARVQAAMSRALTAASKERSKTHG